MSNVVVVHIVQRVFACYVARFETFGMKDIAVVVGSVVLVNVCMDPTVFKSVPIMKHVRQNFWNGKREDMPNYVILFLEFL
jgi:hypothetical protein